MFILLLRGLYVVKQGPTFVPDPLNTWKTEYVTIQNTTIVVQAQARFIAMQTRYIKLRVAVIIIQCWPRAPYSKKSLLELRRTFHKLIIFLKTHTMEQCLCANKAGTAGTTK